MEGVQDEDDFPRFRHHFYDPVNNRGLTATGPLGIPVRGDPAPDWALEDRQDFSTQDFSYRDAREAFLTALTAASPGEREAALARTFETLGHVIHLVQDTASPPHARNDNHGGFGFGPPSLYERHLDQAQVRRRLHFNGTPVPLALPRHYWTTGDGRGLAEFTNQNFVSEGTNFTTRVDGAIGRGGYPSPVLRLGTDEQGRPFEVARDIQTQLEPGLQDKNGNLIEGSVTFFANNFHDPITGEALRNERMTTLSLFDRELARRDEALVFTLNRYNVEAQAAFLIPRAVGYAAGLLDYFFRGTLDFTVRAGATLATQREITITNTSEEAMRGTFTLYAEDANQVRTAVAAFDLPLEPGAMSPALSVTPPAEVRAFVLVFRGRLGAEEGAVAGKRKLAGANAFSVWQVRFYNDQFDWVQLGPELEVAACSLHFLEQFTASGRHTGVRQAYFFFAFVHEPSLGLPPLDVAALRLTGRLSPVPDYPSLVAYPFSGGRALGIIQAEGGLPCGGQVYPFGPAVAEVIRSADTQRYVVGTRDGQLRDTGVVASADIFRAQPLTAISWEDLQALAQRLHPRLTPPPGFPRTAAAYAVAHFDIPNVDPWAVSDTNKVAWGSRSTPITSATVVEMWDLDQLTLHLEEGTDLQIPRGIFAGSPRQIQRHDFNFVFGEAYRRTERLDFHSIIERHNPLDPFVPIREPLP